MTDTFLGDDFFHNGAFRQSMGYEFLKSFESSKETTPVKLDADAYDWYLGQKSLSKITEQLGGKLPTWDAFVAHPNYDDYWKARAAQRYLTKTSVPTLVVGGWFDPEDFFGVFATYEALEKHDKNNQNFLVLGPWNHGGWKRGFGRNAWRTEFWQPDGATLPRSNSCAMVCFLSQRQSQTGAEGGSHFSKWVQSVDFV